MLTCFLLACLSILWDQTLCSHFSLQILHVAVSWLSAMWSACRHRVVNKNLRQCKALDQLILVGKRSFESDGLVPFRCLVLAHKRCKKLKLIYSEVFLPALNGHSQRWIVKLETSVENRLLKLQLIRTKDWKRVKCKPYPVTPLYIWSIYA